MRSHPSLANLLSWSVVLGLAACGGQGAVGSDDANEDSERAGSRSSSGDGGTGTSDDEDGKGDSGDGGPVVNYVPMFPGAPSGEVGKPLAGGEICDEVLGATVETVSEVTRCFYGPEESVDPAATLEQVLECVDGTQAIHLRLTFNPNFNDNTYGAGSIGWPNKRGHWFRDLTGSDHAELMLVDGDGNTAMQFKLDYIEEDASAPSGYASQCVTGGDGEVAKGDASHILDCTTSLDENLNARGYSEYTSDSPLTDESYSVNSDAPDWDYRLVFDVWVDLAAFGDAGFAGAFIESVHASPAKAENDTIEVVSEECPPCEPGPDHVCADQAPPPTEEEDECVNQPDDVCGGELTPPVVEQEPPPFCEQYPTDPACVVY